MSVDRRRPRVRCSQRVAVLVAASVVGVLLALTGLGGQTASAHTGFESSTPADGETVGDPVDIVTIRFTGEATPVGDEFVALNAEGVLQAPVEIFTGDDRVFTLRFDPPLAGGTVGIRWNVQAADAHPIEGAFSFTVDAPAPTTTTPPPATTAPTTEPAENGVADAPSDAETAAVDDASAPPQNPDVGEATSDEAAPSDAVDDPTAAANSTPAEPAGTTLDEFLAVDDSTPGEATARVGRVVGFAGVALGIGAFAFLVTTLRGRRDEIRTMLLAVLVLGIVIAVGAAVEYVGVARIGGESLASGWSTSPGFATVLRLVGGIGLALGAAGTISRVGLRAGSPRHHLSAAVVDDAPETAPRSVERDGSIARFTPSRRTWPATAGVVLVVASFWFDGHTVSKGFRPLHALVNSIHVLAGAVWVGGVFSLTAIVWARHRAGRQMRVVELVLRFSRIATVALASVVAAGAVMAFLVLDSFGELTGTPWGRILLLKTGAVGLAMIGGAYNHVRLLPALEADPDSPGRLAELRSTLTAEAIVLGFVVIVTAWLVAAAS